MKIDFDDEEQHVSVLAGCRTYSWFPRTSAQSVGPTDAALARVVTQSVEATLAAKGFRSDGQPPDTADTAA